MQIHSVKGKAVTWHATTEGRLISKTCMKRAEGLTIRQKDLQGNAQSRFVRVRPTKGIRTPFAGTTLYDLQPVFSSTSMITAPTGLLRDTDNCRGYRCRGTFPL
jgi:hypothetical protein